MVKPVKRFLADHWPKILGGLALFFLGVFWDLVKPDVRTWWAEGTSDRQLVVYRSHSKQFWLAFEEGDSLSFMTTWMAIDPGSPDTDVQCRLLLTYESYPKSDAVRARKSVQSFLDHYVILNPSDDSLFDVEIPVHTGLFGEPDVMASRNVDASFKTVPNPRWRGGLLTVPEVPANDTAVVKLRWNFVNERPIAGVTRRFENPTAIGVDDQKVTYSRIEPWTAEQIYILVDEGGDFFPTRLQDRAGGPRPGVERSFRTVRNAVNGPWDPATCNRPRRPEVLREIPREFPSDVMPSLLWPG